jgi:hypothetical protein
VIFIVTISTVTTTGVIKTGIWFSEQLDNKIGYVDFE